MRIQPRYIGREQMSSGLIDAVRETVEAIASMNNCSKSFVISTILADVFGIKEQVRYYDLKRNHIEGKISKARRGISTKRNKQGKRTAA